MSIVPLLALLALSRPAVSSAGSWTTVAPMPVAEIGAFGAAVNGIFYVAGGTQGVAGTCDSRLQSFDPSTNSWSALASMPGCRWTGDGAGVINGQIYVVGGWTWSPPLPNNNLFVYDPATNSWSTKANLPALSGCGVAGVIGGKLYVTSACDGYGGYRNFLYVYDPGTDSWATLAPSPVAHAGPAGGVMNGKFYVAGGYDGTTYTNRLDVYDPATNTWATMAPMPTARSGMAGAVINGRLYAMGGGSGTSVCSTVEVYDPATDSWATESPMLFPRQGMAAAVMNGKIYVAGGGDSTGPAQPTVQVFTPETPVCDFRFSGMIGLDPAGSCTDPAVGDFNGDGKLDLATNADGYSAPGRVMTFLGHGDGTFDPRIESDYSHLSGTWGGPVIPADYNNDGFLDVAMSNGGSSPQPNGFGNQFTVHLGDGTGRLIPSYKFTTGGSVTRLAAADFNEDHNVDLIVPSCDDGTVRLFRGNGDGRFTLDHAILTGFCGHGTLSADLNGDGDADVLTTENSSHRLAILLGDGAGGFTVRFLALTRNMSWQSLGDLNRDGHPDVVMMAEGYLTVFLGNGDGTFQAARETWIPDPGPDRVVVADFSLDGNPDVAVGIWDSAHPTNGRIALLCGDGTGNLGSSQYLAPGFSSPGAVGQGDFNADGHPDLVTTNGTIIGVLLNALHQITASAGPNGSISPSGTVVVPDGASQTFTITPDPHYHVADVLVDGVSAGAETSYTFTNVTADHTVAASFAIDTHVLTVTVPGHGSVVRSPDLARYDYGAIVRLTAIPSPGWKFDSWSGDVSGSSNPLDVTIDGDKSITATFVPSPEPRLLGILDIGNDQGRRVRSSWARSFRDRPAIPNPVTRYDIFRRIDPLPLLAGGTIEAVAAERSPVPDPNSIMLAGWDYLMSVPAACEDEYNVVVPTLADSNMTGMYWSVFMVRAATATPAMFFDSPIDSGYSVDNLPPLMPQSFTATYAKGSAILHWSDNTEPDFWAYRLYRGGTSDFVPGPDNLIATTGATRYVDPDPGLCYKLAAVDVNGNESPYAQLLTPVDVPAGRAVLAFELKGALPNPVRGTRLTVTFTLPAEAAATLELLDVTGRRVAVREVGSLGAGQHSVDLTEGRAFTPGLYFLRLTQGPRRATQRVVVIR